MKLCPHCHRKMPLKKLTPYQLAIVEHFHRHINSVFNTTMYTASVINEFKNLYPSFKGSQKLILKHLCHLGCKLDSIKINGKTVGIIIIK